MSGNCFSSCIQKVPGKVNAGEFQVNASLTPPRWRCFAKLLKQLKLFRLLDLYLPTLGSRHKPKIRLEFTPYFQIVIGDFFTKVMTWNFSGDFSKIFGTIGTFNESLICVYVYYVGSAGGSA